MTFPVPSVHSTADEEQLQRLFFEGNDLWRERAALREDYGYQSITASLSLVVAALFIVLTVVPGFAGLTGALLQGDSVAQSDLLSVLVLAPVIVVGFLWHRHRMTVKAVRTVQELDSVESALRSRTHDRVRNDVREHYGLDITVTAAGTYCIMWDGAEHAVDVDYFNRDAAPRMVLRDAPVMVR